MKIHATVPELWKNGLIYDLPSFFHFILFAKKQTGDPLNVESVAETRTDF